jgi:vanillate O-demethylase ferredoxin subunit
MAQVLADASTDHHLYVCGPTGFMQFVMDAAVEAGWSNAQLHQEHFAAAPIDQTSNRPFRIEVLSSGQTIEVPANQTATQALLAHGFDVPISCEQGVCGTCMTRVLAGIPEHRDVFMTDEEHASNQYFTPCCSRAKSETLVIELG